MTEGPFICGTGKPEDFIEGHRIYDIMEACGVKEDDQDRIWYAVHAIVDKGQNYWYNVGRESGFKRGVRITKWMIQKWIKEMSFAWPQLTKLNLPRDIEEMHVKDDRK